MAVISLDFSSVLTCSKVNMLPFNKLGRGPSADQVDRLLHRSPAMGTAHRPFGFAQVMPAVGGYHLAGHEGRHRPGAINETLLELPRGQPGKLVAGSIVGGMPWTRSGKVRNHSSLPLSNISTWAQESAPQSTAQMTAAAMSGD